MTWGTIRRRTFPWSWTPSGLAFPTGNRVIDARVEAFAELDRGGISWDDIPAAIGLDERYGDLTTQLGRPTRSAILISRDGSAYRRGPKPGGAVWSCALLPVPGADSGLLSIGAAGWLLGITPGCISAYRHHDTPGPCPFPKEADRAGGMRLWRRQDLFRWHSQRPGTDPRFLPRTRRAA